MKNALTKVGLLLTLVAGLALSVAAQTPQTTTPQDGAQHPPRGMRRGGRGMGGHGGMMRGMQELNLTDAQREQLRALHQRNAESSRAQREELRQLRELNRQGTATAEQQARLQALREELRATMQRTHTEALAVLTAEQRALLEQRRQEMRERREEFRERRRERRHQGNNTNNQTNP